jgi:Rrf2 family protein
MKLTRASNYALQALAHLAAGDGRLLTSHRIASAYGLPEKFLLKVLRPLASAQILRSVKGPNGGYRLARPAAKITLLEVVEAVDGPIRGRPPLGDGPPDVLTERLQAICEDVAAQVRKALGRVRLSDLAGKS